MIEEASLYGTLVISAVTTNTLLMHCKAKELGMKHFQNHYTMTNTMWFVIRSHVNGTKAAQFVDVLQQVLLVVKISSKLYEDFIGISHFVVSLFVEFSERIAE